MAYFGTRVIVKYWTRESVDQKEYETARRISTRFTTGLLFVLLMVSAPLFYWNEVTALIEVFLIGIVIYALARLLIHMSMKNYTMDK